jgi:hypothetical protein
LAIAATLPEHETHHHENYGLTCEQYEGLLADCDSRCETCGQPASMTTRRKLFIDHDGSIGQWAVRGLLCGKCNAALRYDRDAPGWAAAYLASPWWRRTLESLGVPPAPPEPDTSRVLDFFDRLWFRRQAGWHTGHGKCAVLPWPQLVRKYGPHNLTPFDPPDPVVIVRGRVVGTYADIERPPRRAQLAGLTGTGMNHMTAARLSGKAGSVGLGLPRHQQVQGTDDSGGLVMGWQLVREAEDHGPAALTWRERFALSVLANAAWDSTRECPHGIEDNPDIIRRLRLGRSERYAVIAALCEKGALLQLERGRNGVRAAYAIAPFVAVAEMMSLDNPGAGPVDNAAKGPGNPDASSVDNESKGPENPDASGSAAVLKGPGSVTEGSGNPGLKGPGFPDPIGDDGDLRETRKTPYAQARKALREAFPGLNDTEIDETIRIVKVKFSPQNTTNYVCRLIGNGDIVQYIPCGLSGVNLSDRCRNRDCANCTWSWCDGRCHDRAAASGAAAS